MQKLKVFVSLHPKSTLIVTMVIRLMCGCTLQYTDSWNDACTGTYHTMHGQLQTCSSVTEASTVSGPLAWMAFSGFESSYILLTYREYCHIHVCERNNFYYYMCMCPQYIFHIR